jgi:hypothetical protein
MRQAIGIGTLALVLMLAWAAYALAAFAWVFLIPAGLLVVVQVLAVALPDAPAEKGRFKTRLFLGGDFVYYIGLGAVVTTLGSYLPALDRILSHDARLTYEAALRAEPEIRQAHEAASEAYRRSSRSLEDLDPGLLGNCMMQFQLQQFEPERGEGAGIELMPYPPGCEIPLAIADGATRDAGAFLSTGRDLEAAERAIAAGPRPESVEASLPSEETLFLLLYKVFPCLLLCGVMLKLGKTTAAILK